MPGDPAMIRMLLACDAEQCLTTRREYATDTWIVRLEAEQRGWRCREELDLCPEHAREDIPDDHE